MFSINSLSVSIDTHSILKNLSLSIDPGSTHAIMGPNGSGKSTLAHTIMGNPAYEVTHGKILFNDIPLHDLPAHKRAQQGIFVSFQNPPAIPGLRVFHLLKEIRQSRVQGAFDFTAFEKEIAGYLDLLAMDRAFLERSCNDGFSGGERKRFELLQLLVAQPSLLILDEIDSGLDIDALKLVARVVETLKNDNPQISVLIITHYQRILNYLTPDYVHVLVDGTIVQSGDATLVHTLEQTGYAQL